MGALKFKRVGGASNFISLKNHKEGDILINGDTFTASEVSTGLYPGKPVFVFTSDEGEVSKITGTGLLTHIMNDVEIGSVVRIVYGGKKNVNGNQTHQFTVEVAVDDDE